MDGSETDREADRSRAWGAGPFQGRVGFRFKYTAVPRSAAPLFCAVVGRMGAGAQLFLGCDGEAVRSMLTAALIRAPTDVASNETTIAIAAHA